MFLTVILPTFILAFILAFIIYKNISKIKDWLTSISHLIKSYWIVSIVIVLLSLIAKYLIRRFLPGTIEGYFLEEINFYSSATFAIFVGYYGFRQLEMSRFDKLSQNAYEQEKKLNYSRAKALYKEALSVDPSNFTVLANLTELCLIAGDFELFQGAHKRLEKILSDESDRITHLYLMALNELLNKNIGGAEEYVRGLVEFVLSNPSAVKNYNWDFDDLTQSARYSKLTGESKDILDKVISYLKKEMSDISIREFEKKYSE
jgi:tetratricopeptide (TPR) repeat protein